MKIIKYRLFGYNEKHNQTYAFGSFYEADTADFYLSEAAAGLWKNSGWIADEFWIEKVTDLSTKCGITSSFYSG